MTDKKPRGFAGISPERRREIASMGGKAVPPEKRTFSLDKDKAAAAGALGGKAVPPEKRSFAKDPAFAREAGAKGGHNTPADKRGFSKPETARKAGVKSRLPKGEPIA